MGYKKVCLNCHKSFATTLSTTDNLGVCEKCATPYVFFNHKFSPPRKEDTNSWKVIKFLYAHGFNYGHIMKEYIRIRRDGRSEDKFINAAYPKTMVEAEEFVSLYKEQAQKSEIEHPKFEIKK